MTGDTRIERVLPRILDELGAGPTPDYVDSILARTASTRQRAGLTFREWWLPMPPFAGRTAAAPGVSWRTVGLIALLVLALAAAVMVGGSPPRRLPALFGPAANGRIAYDRAGDIFVGDPVTGQTTAIVTGSAMDSRPIFSPDGSRIAFRRGELETTDASIVVVRADGSDERVIVPSGFSGGGIGLFAWTPDGASLAVGHDSEVTPYWNGELSLFDAAGVAGPRLLTPPLPPVIGGPYFSPNAQVAPILRPPTGDRIVSANCCYRSTLSVMDADGSGVKELISPARDDVDSTAIMEPVWSPDGSRIAFTGGLRASEAVGLHSFIHIVNGDGSELRRLSSKAVEVDPGQLVEERWPAWSPDGSRIVFDRGESAAGTPGATTFRITVVDVETGDERELDAPEVNNGTDPYPGHTWSPDGRSIVVLERPGTRPMVIDAVTGQRTHLPWEADSPPSWQRLAP